MRDFRRNICNDCVHGMVDGINMTCALTNCKPAFAVNCKDFCANDKQHSRHLVAQQMKIDELSKDAEGYISGGGTLSGVILAVAPVITHFTENFLYIYISAFLTIVILAYAIYKYLQTNKMKGIEEYNLYKYKLVHADVINEIKPSPTVPITYIHIMHMLRQLGYAPQEMGKEGGEGWIRILYGDVYMYILYQEEILQVLCPFDPGGVVNDGLKLHNFLLAANVVMAQNRFVQITVREDNYDFRLSGYVKTHEELCKHLSDYLAIINDSIVLQREYFKHYMEQNNSEVSNQTTTSNTTVN